MASLRIGMAFAVAEIAELYARVKYPYNINGPTQTEVLRRISETDIRPQVEEIRAQRDFLSRRLAAHPRVVKVYPSDANFILVKVDDADAMYDYLISHGVIVRNRNRVKGCEGCLRFTVGTPEENLRVTTLLEKY